MKRLVIALALFPISLRGGLLGDHLDFVTVSATASPVYLKQRMAKGSPRMETYTFFQGKFFAGATHDPSIEKMTFLDLARALAPTLVQQNYLPAPKSKSADLLIVVNWGTTLEDFGSNRNDAETQFELSQLNQTMAVARSAVSGSGATSPQAVDNQGFDPALFDSQGQPLAPYSNANLLGYGPQLAKDLSHRNPNPYWTYLGRSPEEVSHDSDLSEERYFVILLAYDYQEILHDFPAGRGQARRPQPLPVWEVRMNIRAAGNNFTQAMPAMARVAAAYYGKNVDGLATQQTDLDKAGHVEVGTPKVIGVVK